MYYIFRVKTRKKDYKKYNNALCTIVNARRDDGLVEVFVQKYNVFLLLSPKELDDV